MSNWLKKKVDEVITVKGTVKEPIAAVVVIVDKNKVDMVIDGDIDILAYVTATLATQDVKIKEYAEKTWQAMIGGAGTREDLVTEGKEEDNE